MKVELYIFYDLAGIRSLHKLVAGGRQSEDIMHKF